MPDPIQQESAPASGRVWLLADSREPELVFAFPFDDELNAAVKRLPGRWFDWRRRHWRVPADPRLAGLVEGVLGRFPDLVPTGDVLAWLSDSHRWRALVTVVARDGAGAFLLRVLSGEPPDDLDQGIAVGEDRLMFPFSADSAEELLRHDGVRLDDLARGCARELRAGRTPAPADLSLEIGDDGEPELTLFTRWDVEPAREFKRLPEAHPVPLAGTFFKRDAGWGVAVPADPALAPQLAEFVEAWPQVAVEERARELIDELRTEHDRAADTVALSYAEDAELDGLVLGGELHPFQRAGVRYALERRRTFIADEQGLGKTVQALATLEADGAFPAVVVCPASMKLTWEREISRWLPHRSVAVLGGRKRTTWAGDAERAEILVLNYDILEAHLETLAARVPRALILDESHYVKNPGARRTKVALVLGTVNDFISSSGTRGRGATDGKTSGALVTSTLNCESRVQSTPAFTWQLRIWNWRSAEKRLWAGSLGSAGLGGRRWALTCTRRIRWEAAEGSRRTVTWRPWTAAPSEAQLVASVSSMSLSRSTPSPLAVAPLCAEARLRGSSTVRVRWPPRKRWLRRLAPKPSALAIRS